MARFQRLQQLLPSVDRWLPTVPYLFVPWVVAIAVHWSLPEIQPPSSGSALFDWLRAIPASSGFYYLLALLIDLYLVRSRLRHDQFLADIANEEEKNKASTRLTEHECLVLKGIRLRGFFFRQRADTTLLGVFVLLASTLYALAFFVPLVEAIDDAAVRVALFTNRFRGQLESVRSGRYWLRTLRTASPVATVALSTDGVHGVVSSNEDLVYVTADGGATWEILEGLPRSFGATPVAGVAIDQNGPRLLVLRNGTVLSPTNPPGWRVSPALPWQTLESVVAAWAGDSGPQLVIGSKGKVLRRTEGTWRELDYQLLNEVTAIDFSEDGRHGLLGTADGGAHITGDAGLTWSRLDDLPLSSTEWLERGWFDTDGLRAVSGDEGTVLVSIGGTWTSPEPVLSRGRGDTMVVEFSRSAVHGMIGFLDGSVHVTQDGGGSWSLVEDLPVGSNELVVEGWVGPNGRKWILGDRGTLALWENGAWTVAELQLTAAPMVVSFSRSARHGLIGLQDGSVLVTEDGGEDWASLESLPWNTGEWPNWAWVGEEGPVAMVGDEGTVLLLRGGRWSSFSGRIVWRRGHPNALPVAVGDDGNSMLIGAVSGVAYETEDRGATWKTMKLPGQVTMVTFGDGTLHGLIGGNDGSLHVTGDGGRSWQLWRAPLDGEDVVVASAIGNDGIRAIIDAQGVVWIRLNENWERSDTTVAGRVTVVAFSPDGAYGVIGNDRSGVLVTANSGRSWNTLGNDLLLAGEVAVAAQLENGGSRTIVGNRGSVVESTERGAWTRGVSDVSEVQAVRFVDVVGGTWREEPVFVGFDRLGEVYLMRAYPRMQLEGVAPERIVEEIQGLPAESILRLNVETFLNELPATNGGASAGENGVSRFFRLDQTDWMRLALLIAMSYLVQLLIRQYQYYLRLAAFLDSRADAVVLSGRFTEMDFDKLVVALGPDAYDFKPVRNVSIPSMLERMAQSRRDPTAPGS